MKRKRQYIWGSTAVLFLLIIILDNKTALEGAIIGIELCIKTVIPALFPFFFLTGVITNTLHEPLGRLFRIIGKLFMIPEGSESLLVLGLLGGYPIGAQAVQNQYRAGLLDKTAAQRILTFCNNPGPAFIFGMVGCLFESPIAPWAIWCIIIINALLTARVQPMSAKSYQIPVSTKKGGIIESSIKAMAKVCSWVILFRVLIAVLHRWILWILPTQTTIFITGLLELTNGCTSLFGCSNDVFRFCCVSILLSFGGLCVTFQTVGVAGDIINRQYFWGKLFQTSLSLPLSYIAAIFIFSQSISGKGFLVSLLSLFVAIFIGYILHKNNTGNLSAHDI